MARKAMRESVQALSNARARRTSVANKPTPDLHDILDAMAKLAADPKNDMQQEPFTSEQNEAAELACARMEAVLRLIDTDLAKVGMQCAVDFRVYKKRH